MCGVVKTKADSPIFVAFIHIYHSIYILDLHPTQYQSPPGLWHCRGNPNLNLYLQLESWVKGRSKICIYIYICRWVFSKIGVPPNHPPFLEPPICIHVSKNPRGWEADQEPTMASARVEVKDKAPAPFGGVQKGSIFWSWNFWNPYFHYVHFFFETFENGSGMVFMLFILCFDIVIAGSLGRETKKSSMAAHQIIWLIFEALHPMKHQNSTLLLHGRI